MLCLLVSRTDRLPGLQCCPNRPGRTRARASRLQLEVSLLRIERNPDLSPPLAAALVEIWTAVTNAGGAVGFVPPVTVDDVWPVASAAFARVGDGTDDLVAALDAEQPVGFGFLVTNAFPLTAHWGTIKRLQRHPARPHQGVGAALLSGLEEAARHRGLQRVVLTVRGGTGRERFYAMHGYQHDGTLPGRLRLKEGLVVDEHHLSKVLDRGAVSPAAGVPLPVQRLDPELPLPTYARHGDAGMDLFARQDVTLGPGKRTVMPTGVAVAVPAGHVGLVHPRSGLAARHGVALVNAPGTIDAGYRGEIQVIVVNLDPTEAVSLRRGDRIAQLVIQRVENARVHEVGELPPSERGTGGFGSTGR